MQRWDVAIVTSQSMVAEAIAERLRAHAHLRLAGAWTRQDAAFDAWVEDPPAVAMIDRQLLGLDPLGAVEGIRDSLRVPILVRADRPTAEYVHLMLTAGAGGVVCACASGDVTVEAIATAAEGRPVISPELRDALQERLVRGHALSYRALSAQERRVAGYVASGATAKEAADRFIVTEATVRKHLGRIYDKLEVRGPANLLVALIQLGVIDVEHLDRGTLASR